MVLEEERPSTYSVVLEANLGRGLSSDYWQTESSTQLRGAVGRVKDDRT
jgi:hypothetical protein